MTPMKALRSLLEVRYESPANQFLFVDSILKSFTTEPLGNNSVVVGGTFEVGLKKERASVLLQPQRIAIDFENFSDEELPIKFFESALGKTVDKLSFSKIIRIGFRTQFAMETEMSIEELIAKYKAVFFKETPALAASVDVAVPLTLKHKDNVINFNSGPMTKKEYIDQHSRIKDGLSVPDVFAYIDIDYSTFPNSQLSKKSIVDFIKEGYAYSQTEAEKFAESLK